MKTVRTELFRRQGQGFCSMGAKVGEALEVGHGIVDAVVCCSAHKQHVVLVLAHVLPSDLRNRGRKNGIENRRFGEFTFHRLLDEERNEVSNPARGESAIDAVHRTCDVLRGNERISNDQAFGHLLDLTELVVTAHRPSVTSAPRSVKTRNGIECNASEHDSATPELRGGRTASIARTDRSPTNAGSEADNGWTSEGEPWDTRRGTRSTGRDRRRSRSPRVPIPAPFVPPVHRSRAHRRSANQ